MGWPSNREGTSSALRTDGFTTSSFHKTRFVNPARHTKYTPYLRTRDRISQIWFNKWTVLIALVLAHFLITLSSLNDNIGDAKVRALQACTKVEDIGSSMASMPHYLSRGVNSLAAAGITQSVQALLSVIDMLMTVVKALILFAIHMFTDTYVCLLSLAITGGLNATAAAITGATDGINKAIDKFADKVDSAIGPMQSVINGAWAAASSVGGGINAGTSVIGGGVNAGTSAIGGAFDDVTGGIGGIFGRAQRSTLVLLNPDATQLAESWSSAQATATSSAVFPRGTNALQLLAERSELKLENATPSTVTVSTPALPTEVSLPLVTLAARLNFGEAPNIVKTLSGPIAELKSFDINAGGIVSNIEALRDKVPTFDEVRKLTEDTIGIPFDMARKALNDSYGAWKFDDTVFPLAAKERLSFCSENSALNDFFESLFVLTKNAKIIALCLLCFLAIAACGWFLFVEIRRGRKEAQYVQTFESEQYDQIDFAHLFSRPRLGWVGIKTAQKLAPKPQDTKKRMLIRWCMAYATSIPALFVLSLAVAGLFSCLCQVVLLKSIESKVPELAAQVGDFADDVVQKLGGVSERWATDANGVMTSFSDELNQDLFGHVETATKAANDTLTVLVDSMSDGLTKAFGGTFLEQPVKDLVRCLVGVKIEGVQKGLTWVHEHAHVAFPLFPNDVFSMGADKSVHGDGELTTFLASPSSVTTDEVTGAVLRVTDWLYRSIITDLFVSCALLLVYALVVLTGVLYTAFALLSPEKMDDREGGGGGGGGGARSGDVAGGRRPVFEKANGHARSSSYASIDYAAGGNRSGGSSEEAKKF
ncbi:Plasma membrane fusion protein prm1 [Microdochium nivale]|nr:Plasma membrane fusion protein prm1 [Microdochium nivale]